MYFKNKLKYFVWILSFSLISSFFFSIPVDAIDYNKEAQLRKTLEVQSNLYENWPLGPAIGAQAAILMDANTGSILYEKNIHEKLYPASITKLLTTYIAMEECQLDEMVTFSEAAVHSIKFASLSLCVMGSLLLYPESWYAQGFVYALQDWGLCLPQSYGSLLIKSHWPSRSNSLGIPSLFVGSQDWEA